MKKLDTWKHRRVLIVYTLFILTIIIFTILLKVVINSSNNYPPIYTYLLSCAFYLWGFILSTYIIGASNFLDIFKRKK